MMDRTSLAGNLELLAAERRAEVHPEPDELLAYHFGTLPEDRRDVLQEHLSVCSECARTVLDMADFPDIEPRSGVIDPAEPGDRELQALEKRIAPVLPFKTVGDGRTIRWPQYLAAAALVLICVGLGWRLAILQSRLEDSQDSVARFQEEMASRPGLGHSFEIVSLQPIGAEDARSSINPPPVISIDNDAVPVVLNVYLSEKGPYSVELVDTSGKVWRSWQGLQPTTRQNLTLMLLPVSWQAGDYELRVTGPGAEAGSPLARFAITIAP